MMRVRWPFAPYGTREIVLGTLLLGGAFGLLLWAFPWAAPVPALLLGFVLSFFRDPERVVPDGQDCVLSPADGRVADIEELREEAFLRADAVRVGIFMSVFDVHVNRAPVSGKVVFRDYRRGKFLDARAAAASRENESAFVGIERADGTRVLVRQVAGLVARRIVCGCEVGDAVVRGARFGMVKFGSRLEVWVPRGSGFRVAVAVGERVRAGCSVLGKFGVDGGPPG
jgi:phosphatidylserine decarboxylase